MDSLQSHPVWVCGLKLLFLGIVLSSFKSHPVWVCGLKQVTTNGRDRFNKSHPVWVSGLKQLTVNLIDMGFIVTPCMGVWIETPE